MRYLLGGLPRHGSGVRARPRPWSRYDVRMRRPLRGRGLAIQYQGSGPWGRHKRRDVVIPPTKSGVTTLSWVRWRILPQYFLWWTPSAWVSFRIVPGGCTEVVAAAPTLVGVIARKSSIAVSTKHIGSVYQTLFYFLSVAEHTPALIYRLRCASYTRLSTFRGLHNRSSLANVHHFQCKSGRPESRRSLKFAPLRDAKL
ncbi:hypothetical protein C8R45DRAFT_293155 [Mycena sanguinolenta]|nr:hypothetical protein C8R45DRAFT_293155 [Mycena sanguinolenta]